MENTYSSAGHENWIAPNNETTKPAGQESNLEASKIATEIQRVFSLESAKAAEENGKLGEWLQEYLKSPEADNLKLADRILVGGCENYALRTIPIDRLARVAGPEDGMMYQETSEVWEQKMKPLRDAVRSGDDFPPLILTDLWNPLRDDNSLVLSDGSHRLEAMRESGVQSTTVLVAFRDSHSFQNILGEKMSENQREPIETSKAPKPKRMLVVNVHPYEDAILARRAVGSIVDNLEETQPDGKVVISLTDDSKSPEARKALREMVAETKQQLRETNLINYDIEYLQANGNEFITKLTQKLKEKGISERQLRFLLSTKMSSGYVGYTASVNQGALRAMYLSGLNGLPRDKSMIFHFDQDEMLKAYNPPHEENTIEYTAEDNDFLGDRFKALKEGAEIIGAKYAVHPGSTASMLKDITDYVRAGLEEYEKDPEDLKRRVPLPISVSEDGENYQVDYLTVEEFLTKLPSIVAASTRRTPVVGYKETSDFDRRVRTNDFTEPPVSRTIRLDASRKLFDPHNMGMHEIIWFLGARAMTEDVEAVKRLPYHIHHRSAEFGNDLQGADLFAETHPHAVQFVYEVGLLSDDELSTNFNPQEQAILKRVRENLGNDASKKIVKKLDIADENINKIKAIVDNMPDNQLTVEAIATLKEFSQKFDGFYPQFKERFNDKVDHNALVKEIKRYFRQQQAWQKICDASFELGVEDAKALAIDEKKPQPIANISN